MKLESPALTGSVLATYGSVWWTDSLLAWCLRCIFFFIPENVLAVTTALKINKPQERCFFLLSIITGVPGGMTNPLAIVMMSHSNGWWLREEGVQHPWCCFSQTSRWDMLLRTVGKSHGHEQCENTSTHVQDCIVVPLLASLLEQVLMLPSQSWMLPLH